MKIKLISNISRMQEINSIKLSFTLYNIYEVVKVEKSREYNNIPLRYKVIDDDGFPRFIPNDCIEIIDSSIPDFWSKKEEFGTIYLSPEGWDSSFFSDIEDGNIETITKFYREYQSFYKNPIKISNKSNFITDGIDLKINSKKAYLKDLYNDDKYFLIEELDLLYLEEDFSLSKDKLYKCYETKNYSNYFYKVKNDKNIEKLYPCSIFDPIKNRNWLKFDLPYLSDKEIDLIINNMGG